MSSRATIIEYLSLIDRKSQDCHVAFASMIWRHNSPRLSCHLGAIFSMSPSKPCKKYIILHGFESDILDYLPCGGRKALECNVIWSWIVGTCTMINENNKLWTISKIFKTEYKFKANNFKRNLLPWVGYWHPSCCHQRFWIITCRNICICKV